MMATFRNYLPAIAFAALALAATELASACSVCAVSKEESRNAYYFTTALMSLVPLGMIGGLVYYVAKKGR